MSEHGSMEASLRDKFAAKRRAWARRPDILKNAHRIYTGDARTLPGLPNETQVYLVVTSPPYWNLKQYEDDRAGAQLGHIESRQEFMAELLKVWRNCYNLLVPGGRLCIVVGDVCRSRKAHGRPRARPRQAERPRLRHDRSDRAFRLSTTAQGRPRLPERAIDKSLATAWLVPCIPLSMAEYVT